MSGRFIKAALAALVLIVAFGLPARAQATRTWVSGVGDDANPCSRTAPCKTFAGAISKTAAAGEINCLDPAGYGALTITKALTINCEGTLGSVLVSGTNAIVVNAGPNDNITLKGLEFEGLNTGINGIQFLAGKSLEAHKIQIRNFTASGIDVEPTVSAQVFISEAYITGGAGSAINLKPGAAANLSASLNTVRLNNNATGLNVDSTATSGTIRVTFRDSVAAGNSGAGVSATGGTNAVRVLSDRSASVNNATGLVATNATAAILASGTTVTGNQTGLNVVTGGRLLTYGTNNVNANIGVDGVFTTTLTQE
ncbi:right-handed parallel beta-helix repeat-containing protein [Beijerinckia sp. L45]|uniref:right-handed parallel beta-helix repeat-containing protein n=1 Tax=Beijerinckia sp. L45 TaxID=1641855 RepID=UPI00131B84C8|nr:right-handed parallel beta-helix repeat-containing protein [Beijerinckia sp. L45]